MCECAALKERVRELESQLQEQVQYRHERLVRERFKLEPGQVWTVLELYKNKGAVIEKYWLIDNRPHKPRKADELDRNDDATLRVHIHYIRKKLGKDAIGRHESVGYYMTASGLERIRECLYG